MSKRIFLVMGLLLLAFTLAACGGEPDAEVIPTTVPEQPLPTTVEDTGAGEVQEEPTATELPTEEPAPTATAEPTTPSPTPAVSVADQPLADSTVTVASVTAAEPGWIVIHADQDGAPGPVIGHAPVDAGTNDDVAVEVDEAAATATLYAMLHLDAGTAGTYEFPGDDAPVSVDGNVVVQPFALTGGLSQQPGSGEAAVGLELVAEGLTAPVVLKPIPDGSGRHIVVDQVGLAYVLDEEGNLLDEPFLDLRDQMVELMSDFDERGFLGLAFHPDYADNGRFFVYYSAPLRASAPADWNHTSHISAFQVSAGDPNRADPDSEQILLQVDEPQFNHDAGQITFGPDGYLYIPLGDGGGANDDDLGHVPDWYDFNEGGNGQDRAENLLGSILRIDVDTQGNDGRPYGIPDDNPFVDSEGIAPEIWAYGFRNPFRISFDSGGDNALYVGDAGQDRWEEVSIVEAGGNYGWNVKEGTHCFDAANPGQPLDDCPATDPEGDPLIDPIIEYQNANQEGGLGLVVIGGYVYRGDAIPGLQGTYVFGDWSDSFAEGNGQLFMAAPAGDGLWQMQKLALSNADSGNLDSFLLSFGQDADGELYLLTSGTTGPTGETGRIYRLVPADMAGEMMADAEATPEPGGIDYGTEEATTPAAEEPAMEETTVTIDNFAFSPAELTVPVGTTVVWTNEQGVAHTVTAGTPDAPTPAQFDSGRLSQGQTFSFTFDKPGSFAYFCTIHPSMQGTIVVEA